MHIPDGFLSPPVWGAFDLLAVPSIAAIARRAQRGMDDRSIPLLGVMGAFVFAAQMINFPVGPGTSGHLVGGALLAIALGPAPASIVMTAILAIQALVFQDGGVIALGANVFNMAIVGVFAGYLPYRLWARASRPFAIFAAGVLSVLASGILALSELVVSGVPMPRRVLFVSLGFFLMNALIEGGITLAAIRAIERLNPRLFKTPDHSAPPALAPIALAAVLLAVAGILIASTNPDGIQRLAAAHSPAWMNSPLAEYRVRGMESPWLRRAIAGIAGLILIYGACIFTGKLIARRSA